MARQKNKTKRQPETAPAPKQEPEIAVKPTLFPFLSTFKAQAIFILLIGSLFYFNTVQNEYALDDDIVVVKNQYVQAGFGGIKDILTKDAFDSFYRQMQANDQLSGGRYRPLSIVSFAIEQQLFGECLAPRMDEIRDSLKIQFLDPKTVTGLHARLDQLERDEVEANIAVAPVRHFVNVALFLLSMVVLLALLRDHFFKSMPDIAFLATLLFTIHPIHTEVIANVKSRDEIMSFLFICLTFIFAFRWRKDMKTSTLTKAAVCYFLALLSKEWGITMVALIPLSFVIFRKDELLTAIGKTVPFFVVAFIYLFIHMKFVPFGAGVGHKEILNNPYLLATKGEKFGTEFYVLFLYLYKLFIPYPFSADYSYNTIPYMSLTNGVVLGVIALHFSMIYFAYRFYSQRNPLAFAIIAYLAFLIMVSNFFFDIGASLGERLVYHSSFGFVIAAAIAIMWAIEKIKAESLRRIILPVIFLPLITLCGFITITRNAQWKNDHSLFIHDAKVVPHAVMANGNAGKSFIEMADVADKNKDTVLRNSYFDSAAFYLQRSFEAHKGYYIGYLNMGYISYRKHDIEKCEEYWNKAAAVFKREGHENFWRKYDEPLSESFHTRGLNYGMQKDFVSAEKYLAKAVTYAPNNSVYWGDYGGANFELKNFQKALDCWSRALQIDPANQQARGGYKALSGKDFPDK